MVTWAAGHQTPGTPRTRERRSSEAPGSSADRGRGAASDTGLPAASAACVSDEETVIMWITTHTNILIGHIVHTRGEGDDYHLLTVICILPATFCSMRAVLFCHHQVCYLRYISWQSATNRRWKTAVIFYASDICGKHNSYNHRNKIVNDITHWSRWWSVVKVYVHFISFPVIFKGKAMNPCQGHLGANQSFIYDCRKFGHSPSWWKWFAEIDIFLQSWFVVTWWWVSAKYWLKVKLNLLGESTGRKWKIPRSTCKFSHDAAQNLSSIKFNQFSRKIHILHFVWNVSPLNMYTICPFYQ